MEWFEGNSFKKHPAKVNVVELMVKFRTLSVMLDVTETTNLTTLVSNVLTKDADEL